MLDIILIVLFVLFLIACVLYFFQLLFAFLELFGSYSNIKTRQDLIDAFTPFRPMYLKIKDKWNTLK